MAVATQQALDRTPPAFDAEGERAAIVAYTGLWQLREWSDPDAEEPEELRTARIWLRGMLDGNDQAWEAAAAEPVEEVQVLTDLHIFLTAGVESLRPNSPWGAALRSVRRNLGRTLGRRERLAFGLTESQRDRFANWVCLEISGCLEVEDRPTETLRGVGEINRLASLLRALRGESELTGADRETAEALAVVERAKCRADGDEDGARIAGAVLADRGGVA